MLLPAFSFEGTQCQPSYFPSLVPSITVTAGWVLRGEALCSGPPLSFRSPLPPAITFCEALPAAEIRGQGTVGAAGAAAGAVRRQPHWHARLKVRCCLEQKDDNSHCKSYRFHKMLCQNYSNQIKSA